MVSAKHNLALAALLAVTLPAMAASNNTPSAGTLHLFRFYDAQHKLHLDQQLSDDALNAGYDELDLNMNVLRTVPPRPSGKDLERLKAEQARREQALEQARQDALLKRMYSSPADATRDRDSQVDAIQLRIDFTNSAIVRLRSMRAAEAEKAAAYERNGSPVPKEIQDNISQDDKQIAAAEADIQTRRVEQEHVRAQFADIVKRLQTLEGNDPDGAAASGTATASH